MYLFTGTGKNEMKLSQKTLSAEEFPKDFMKNHHLIDIIEFLPKNMYLFEGTGTK